MSGTRPVGAGRRLLLVHAHPDDETITTGATMARYAAEGAEVTLVTCTRGEQGEVIGVELDHLAGDGAALAAHRERELAAAMAALGVRDHRFLGAGATGADGRPVRFVDSGMVWGPDGLATAPADLAPGAFAGAEVDDAATHLARVLREVRPQVLVTYEPGGGYGHPDHVQAHRVAMRAVQLAEDPRLEVPGRHGSVPWRVPKVYWVVVPRTVHGRAVAGLADRGLTTHDPQAPPMTMLVPDEQVTCRVDAESHRDAKASALRAHATQVLVAADESAFALSNEVWQPLSGTEYFLRAARPGLEGQAPTGDDDAAPEHDLFDGLTGDDLESTGTGRGARPGADRSARRRATLALPVLAVLPALLVGVLAGLSGVLWHHVTLVLPQGRLALGLLVTVSLLGALGLTVALAARNHRWPVLALLLGWAGTVALAALPDIGGDALISLDRYGIGYVVASALVLLVVTVVVPRRWARR